jgi:hypothetical protein
MPKYSNQISDGVGRMMTYLFGPFLSLLPATWRANLPWAESTAKSISRKDAKYRKVAKHAGSSIADRQSQIGNGCGV